MKRFCLFLVPGTLAFLATVVFADPTDHRGPVTSLLAIDGELVSCSQAGVFRGFGREQSRLVSAPFRVLSLAARNGNRELVLTGGLPGESGIIASWSFEDKALATREIADDLVYAVAASSQGIFAALANGDVLQFDPGLETNKVRHRHTAAARSVAVSPDEAFLASGGMDRVIFISRLDPRSKPVLVGDHTGGVDCLTFSRDGQQIASGARDGKVRIHFSDGGKLVRTYQGLRGEVTTLAWGKRLIAGTSEGLLYELSRSGDDAKLLKELGPDSPITALAMGEENRILAGTLHGITVVSP